jgi:hypothetical protein
MSDEYDDDDFVNGLGVDTQQPIRRPKQPVLRRATSSYKRNNQPQKLDERRLQPRELGERRLQPRELGERRLQPRELDERRLQFREFDTNRKLDETIHKGLPPAETIFAGIAGAIALGLYLHRANQVSTKATMLARAKCEELRAKCEV